MLLCVHAWMCCIRILRRVNRGVSYFIIDRLGVQLLMMWYRISHPIHNPPFTAITLTYTTPSSTVLIGSLSFIIFLPSDRYNTYAVQQD